MRSARDATNQAKIKAGILVEGGAKRLGALFLKVWAVPVIPIGLGLMLWGLFSKFEQRQYQDPLSVGVALVILGGILWFLSRRLDESAQLVRYRSRQNSVIRLARERGGKLMVTETAADTGITMEEADRILRDLVDGGYVEMEVSDSGMVVYRFPEIVFEHEKSSSRSIDAE